MAGGISTKIVAAIVVVILVIAGLAAYYLVINGEEKETGEDKTEDEIDDRITPYTIQGLIVEVNRIRNRGLMDKILVVGSLSWRQTPSFYYKIEVDEKVGTSQGNVGTYGVFNKWDTFGEDSSMSFYVDQGQESVKVKITIIEQIKKGLLKRRVSEVEKEEINLIYDFKTGRWKGDDYLKDEDGYGHYLGEEYEVWFNLYQNDFDNDGIPYWIEKNILKTNPVVDDSILDPDNDGIPTSWEWKWDYDPFTYNDHMNLDPDVDGIENIEEYQMSKWFANPYQPDIYIETDSMKKKNIFDVNHIFFKESQQMLIERFAQHGINVYIDDGWPDGPINGGGEMLPFYDNIDDVDGKLGVGFYKHHFAEERKDIFRYVIVANKAGLIHPSEYNSMDTIIVGSNWRSNLMVKRAFTPRMIRVSTAKLILHELGHSIGLLPITFYGNDIQPKSWGDRYPNMPESEYNKYVENYHSVMNYNYIHLDKTLFDYSDGSNGAPYDQNDWDYIYLPTFQTDGISFEEPVDETFEDFEIVNNYPGVILEGWELDESLSSNLESNAEDFVTVKNADVEIIVYKETNTEHGKNRIKVYAKPVIEPTFALWSLVSEGYVDSDGIVEFYSIGNLIQEKIK